MGRGKYRNGFHKVKIVHMPGGGVLSSASLNHKSSQGANSDFEVQVEVPVYDISRDDEGHVDDDGGTDDDDNDADDDNGSDDDDDDVAEGRR